MSETAANIWQTLQDRESPPADLLGRLVKLIHADPGPDILTLDDFKRRYRLTGRGPLAIAAIEQSQRINRAIGNFVDTGLCEFQIGLIYLYWQDYRGAAQQFREARQQWSFIDKTASVCLAYFAEGLALHSAFAYEAALAQYGKAEHALPRIRFEAPSTNQNTFETELSAAISSAQTAARDALWQPTAETDTSQTPSPDRPGAEPAAHETGQPDDSAVPPPEFSPPLLPHRLPSPIPSHINSNEKYAWYRVPVQQQDQPTDFKQQGWLLVNKHTEDHIFNRGDLIVIADDDHEANLVLVPHSPEERTFPRICLGRAKFEGAFTRDAYNVQLSTRVSQIPVGRNDIVGFVVGWWLEVGDSEILEGWN